MTKPRVLSLIASATEMVCALECQSLLVGRSHECDYPGDITKLPVCTEARVSMEPPSLDIHSSVEALLNQALSLYEVKVEQLAACNPDIIITQDHCRVCAVSLDDVTRALTRLQDHAIEVVSLFPSSLKDIWNDLRTIASALGCPERAEMLITRLQQELEAVCPSPGHRPGVVCLEWTNPLMACGNWIPSLIDYAGGTELLGKADVHSGIISKELLLDADPDVLIAAPCGFDLSRSRKEALDLFQDPDLQTLRAYKEQQVYVADGNAFFNRPGPRIVESAQIIKEIIGHSADCPHHGSAWDRL